MLVSRNGAPLLLTADGAKGWTKTELPGGDEDLGRPSACVVADLDNDGFVDVLQPAERGSLLWKGKAGGFEKPRRVAVATGGGTALAAVGDFDQDGLLDIFLAGQEKNTLWENDGKGNFREVLRFSGSPGYKCPVGACGVQALDLNHDGRMDLCLIYEQDELLYHFNRGFRSFASEAEVRLPRQANPGELHRGPAGDRRRRLQRRRVLRPGRPADQRGPDLLFQRNDGRAQRATALARGVTGPVTASCWVGDDYAFCSGVACVPGHSPAAFISTRNPGDVPHQVPPARRNRAGEESCCGRWSQGSDSR